eukprot:1101575-Prorocentrum_minimum.AAC.1
MQYEGRDSMETTARVTLRESTPLGEGEQRRGEQSMRDGHTRWPEFVLSGSEDTPESIRPAAASNKSASASEEGLRKRHTQSQSPSQATTSQSASGTSDGQREKENTSDGRASPKKASGGKTQQATPLAWFSGGMVSPALREAKTDFSLGMWPPCTHPTTFGNTATTRPRKNCVCPANELVKPLRDVSD